MVTRKHDTRLVIWDWNGTLLDDTEFCYRIANQMRAERGMSTMASVEEYRGLFGFPVKEYYRRMGYTFETESYEEISVEFLRLYAEGVHTCPLQPEAKETLKEIKAMGIPQILLSATGADRLAGQAALYDLPQYFDDICGADNNLAHGKAQQAAERIALCGCKPGEVLFVGDTDHDREVSEAVGCRCVLLVPGHQTRAHLDTLGVPLMDALHQVLDWL